MRPDALSQRKLKSTVRGGQFVDNALMRSAEKRKRTYFEIRGGHFERLLGQLKSRSSKTMCNY
jgi:hypothetical protein